MGDRLPAGWQRAGDRTPGPRAAALARPSPASRAAGADPRFRSRRGWAARRRGRPEHGPDGDDEVNLVTRGANYGWPRARGRNHAGFRAPLLVYGTSIAPSGATFVTRPGSSWTGDYLFAALRGEQLRRVRFDGRRPTRNSALFVGRFGRLRTVVEAPDGSLLVLTNNRDGRGSPRNGDDRILRIVPPARPEGRK